MKMNGSLCGCSWKSVEVVEGKSVGVYVEARGSQ